MRGLEYLISCAVANGERVLFDQEIDQESYMTPDLELQSVVRTLIRDPVPFDPWIRDPGCVKNKDPDTR